MTEADIPSSEKDRTGGEQSGGGRSDEGHPLVLLEHPSPGIVRLVLNNPARYNALSMAMIAALEEALGGLFATPSVRAVIIAAKGRGFCAGHDLKELHAHRADEDGGRAFYIALFDRCCGLMLRMVRAPKVIIAEVEGIATAAGAQLVASCDMVVASPAARFGVNGVSAGLFCSTPMVALSRAIGRNRCIELLATGRLMDAAEAREAGLVNHVAENPAEKALELAGAVAAKSAAVVALGKRAFYRQLEMPLEDAYAYTRGVIVENLLMHDAEEGICAFVEKRPPQWKDS